MLYQQMQELAAEMKFEEAQKIKAKFMAKNSPTLLEKTIVKEESQKLEKPKISSLGFLNAENLHQDLQVKNNPHKKYVVVICNTAEAVVELLEVLK